MITDPQGDLFALKSRRTDPATSKAAGARHTGDRVRPSQARVMAALRLYGPQTDKELVELVKDMEREQGFQKVQSDSGVRSRRAELVKLGRVEPLGERVVDGYRCTVWGLVNQEVAHDR